MSRHDRRPTSNLCLDRKDSKIVEIFEWLAEHWKQISDVYETYHNSKARYPYSTKRQLLDDVIYFKTYGALEDFTDNESPMVNLVVKFADPTLATMFKLKFE
jgi:hypothetical protein